MIKTAACGMVLVGALGWSAGAEAGSGAEADFEGRVIDLTVGWGDAKACMESAGQIVCYRSEAQMLTAYASQVDLSQASVDGPVAAAATCSSSLRLYDGTGFSGQVLMLTTRLTGLNLSSYGFDNKTSSYKVGACGVSMYSASNLGGSLYPGATGANASAVAMNSGWDNTISSVWIG